ncbi:RICIN domain-containing protein, partial [Streptomyces sp. NPDC002920]
APVDAAPVDAAPVDAACDDASGGRPASPVRRWARAVVARLGRPWVCLTAGVVAGVLVGAALTPLMWRPAPVSGPGSPGAAASLSTHKEGHGTGAALTDRVRIFVSRATGACLDDSLDFGLRSYACNGMSYQRWTEHPFPDGTRRLRNHATGRCLHGDGAGLRTRSCSTSTAQKWLLTAWYDESVEVRSKAAGSCLDDDTSAGLRFLPCDRTKRQKWG